MPCLLKKWTQNSLIWGLSTGSPRKVFASLYLSWASTQISACVYMVNNYYYYFLSNIYFFTLAFWLFLIISEPGNGTHINFVLLRVKEVRHPRSGEVDTGLHMSTCAYFKDVNHSLGELPLWKGPDFLLKFVLLGEQNINAFDSSLSYWYLMYQVKILAWWTRRQHGDFLALFPTKLAGCTAAGAQQSG